MEEVIIICGEQTIAVAQLEVPEGGFAEGDCVFVDQRKLIPLNIGGRHIRGRHRVVEVVEGVTALPCIKCVLW